MRNSKKILLVLVAVVGILLLTSLLFNYTDIPLRGFIPDDSVLPVGWVRYRTYSHSASEMKGALEDIVIIWQQEDSRTSEHPTFMEVSKHKNTLIARYWYYISTSKSALPREVYYVPAGWKYKSEFADQISVVCHYPNAGIGCRVYARYGQYIVIFQLVFRRESDQKDRETLFEITWAEMDAFITQIIKK